MRYITCSFLSRLFIYYRKIPIFILAICNQPSVIQSFWNLNKVIFILIIGDEYIYFINIRSSYYLVAFDRTVYILLFCPIQTFGRNICLGLVLSIIRVAE